MERTSIMMETNITLIGKHKTVTWRRELVGAVVSRKYKSSDESTSKKKIKIISCIIHTDELCI